MGIFSEAIRGTEGGVISPFASFICIKKEKTIKVATENTLFLTIKRNFSSKIHQHLGLKIEMENDGLNSTGQDLENGAGLPQSPLPKVQSRKFPILPSSPQPPPPPSSEEWI